MHSEIVSGGPDDHDDRDQLSERPAIEYPESDGLPIADNTLQFRWISTVMWGLDTIFLHDPERLRGG